MSCPPRPAFRALLLTMAVVLPATGVGCSLVATGMWMIDPKDREAEYKGLRDCTVAVVCRAGASQQMEAAGATHEIARQVSVALKQNIKHIHLVSQKDVNDWLDNNEMKSYEELGKAVKADKVVAIELAQMSLYDGKTLYQGRAQANITVYDIVDGDNTPLRPLDVSYPPRNGVPTDIPERQFRAKFLEILSGQIGRRFYAYDSREVFDDYYTESSPSFNR